MTVRGQGFAQLHTVKEAQLILLNHARDLQVVEDIPVQSALGRKLASDIIAPRNQPGFRRAAMDGFCVKAHNTYGASDTSPRQLNLIGAVEIGDQQTIEIEENQAVRISTGAPVPVSGTAVIKLEDCEVFDDTVEIYSSVAEGRNIAEEDEDVKKGEVVLKKSTRLLPWDVAMLLSLSIETVKVIRKPRVATLSTGNELIAPSNIPQLGQVVDSNRPAINSWLEYLQTKIVDSRHCVDEPETIKKNILELSKTVDLIVTSGGTSVGTKDFLAEIIDEVGELWVHGIAIRPGKPVALGCIHVFDRKVLIISLPGYPLAAFLNFHLFVSYLVGHWTNHPGLFSRVQTVTLVNKIPSRVGTRDFVRLRKSDDGAELIRISGAGILSSLVSADYLLEIDDDLEGYNAGDEVEVYVLR